MAYWVKTRATRDFCTDYDGNKLDYTVTSYSGPFRTLQHLEEYLSDNQMEDAEVLEFE